MARWSGGRRTTTVLPVASTKVVVVALLATAATAMTAAAFQLPSRENDVGRYDIALASPSRPSSHVAFPSFHNNRRPSRPPLRTRKKTSSTSLNLLGSDSGILGVGAPEIAVTLLVGYFVLGPSDLYKLVKEIGKFIQNVRTLGTEAARSFEGTMEDQLELTELRKAQNELNAAFGFRRSINTDEYGTAFDRGLGGSSATTTATAGAGDGSLEVEEGASSSGGEDGEEGGVTATTTTRKRRLVRRRKKKAPIVVEGEDDVDDGGMGGEEDDGFSSSSRFASMYPDLDAVDGDDDDVPPIDDDADYLRAERARRLTATRREGGADDVDWYQSSEADVASAILDSGAKKDDARSASIVDYDAGNRFRSQLSAEEWNSKVMANEDRLSPRECYISYFLFNCDASFCICIWARWDVYLPDIPHSPSHIPPPIPFTSFHV